MYDYAKDNFEECQPGFLTEQRQKKEPENKSRKSMHQMYTTYVLFLKELCRPLISKERL